MDNGHVEYDFLKLQRIEELIINESEIQTLDDLHGYFDRLTGFIESSPGFLAEYNPSIVSSRDNERRNFLNSLKEIRETLMSLGMTAAASDLIYLENAVFKKNASVLENEFSAFHLRMQKMSELIASARIDGRYNKPRPDSKPVILAVDDMSALLSTVVKMLRDAFAVIAVTSGRAALKALEKHTPALFLLDIDMPQMNGYELAAAIRRKEEFQLTPIIFLTAKSSRSDVITAMKKGGNDYIIKPVDKDLLIEKIWRQLE